MLDDFWMYSRQGGYQRDRSVSQAGEKVLYIMSLVSSQKKKKKDLFSAKAGDSMRRAPDLEAFNGKDKMHSAPAQKKYEMDYSYKCIYNSEECLQSY